MASKYHPGTLLGTYGITVDEYRKMEAKQNRCCAICGGKNGLRSLGVDHDHETKKVRGLLCNSCNSGLGMFKDNIKLLAKAIVYLEDNGKRWDS